MLVHEQLGRAVDVIFVHTASMNDDAALSKLIAEAVEEARQQGLDYVGQTERAVKAVSTVRPDLTASDALTLVKRLKQE